MVRSIALPKEDAIFGAKTVLPNVLQSFSIWPDPNPRSPRGLLHSFRLDVLRECHSPCWHEQDDLLSSQAIFVEIEYVAWRFRIPSSNCLQC